MSRWWEEMQLYILTNILTWNELACLARRLNLTWVSNVCEAAPIFLFWAPNGLNESWTRRTFRIFFHLESSSFPGFSPTHPTEERTMGTRLVLSRKSTMAFLTGQSWRVVKSWYGWGPQNKDFGAVAQTAQRLVSSAVQATRKPANCEILFKIFTSTDKHRRGMNMLGPENSLSAV